MTDYEPLREAAFVARSMLDSTLTAHGHGPDCALRCVELDDCRDDHSCDLCAEDDA